MSKLPNVGTTIFTVMSKMANEHNAINLSQGFPNFPIAKRLEEIYAETVNKDVHQYAPMPGNSLLREELAKLTWKSYQRKIDVEREILLTAGGTQGIFTAIQALVEIGDEVIILNPAYDSYEPAVVLAGGKPININLDERFHPDFEKIKTALSNKTRMIIVNNPHNPSGTIWPKEYYDTLADLLENFPRVLVLSDEVYEYITYDKSHFSIHNCDKLRNRAIVISSFGKTFHITGWKVGYLITTPELMTEIKKVHQFLVFCVNSVAQATLAKYLQEVDVAQLAGFYRQKRDLFRSLLANSRLELFASEGSYYQTVSYKNISTEDDISFTKRLITEIGVAAIPVSAFFADKTDRHVIRLCFAKKEETLREAARRLCNL